MTVIVQFSAASWIAAFSVAQVASGPGPTVIAVSLATVGAAGLPWLAAGFDPCAVDDPPVRAVAFVPSGQNFHVANAPATTTATETSRAAQPPRAAAGGWDFTTGWLVVTRACVRPANTCTISSVGA